MGMMMAELSKAISVKSCYSKFLLSSAVFMLTILLSAAFLAYEPRDAGKQAFLDPVIAVQD